MHRIFPRGATSVQKGYHLEPGHRQPVAQCHYCKDKRACQRRVCDARVRRHDVRSLVGNRLQMRISLKLCNDRKIMYSIIITDVTVDKNRWVKELGQAFEDKDKLKPIRCLTGLFNVTDPEHFLLKESVGKK